jgi:hypothetical protein
VVPRRVAPIAEPTGRASRHRARLTRPRALSGTSRA